MMNRKPAVVQPVPKPTPVVKPAENKTLA